MEACVRREGMEVAVKAGALEKESADASILMLYEGESELQGAAALIDKALDGALTRLLQDGEFTGKSQQHMVLHTQGRLKTKRVILSGLGKPDQLTLDGL